jgi:zinc protease
LPGPFVARAAVRSDVTDSSLAAVFAELNRMREETVSEAELTRAQAYLELGALSEWETTGDVATQLATLHAFGLPITTVTRDLDAIRRLTAADVQRAARAYVDPAYMTVVVVGDVEKIRPGIEALKLGTVEVRDGAGRRLGR